MKLITTLPITLALLAISIALAWYAVCSNRIAAKDLTFIADHDSTALFAAALLLKGNHAYYDQLNPGKAIQYYRKAVSHQPLFIPAWLALARTELAQGEAGKAGQVSNTLEDAISSVSTWKWQEMLLAYDLRDEEYFRSCFNFVLNRLPNRISDACYLASQFWGSYAAAIPQLTPANQSVYLDQLMKIREVDAAVSLFDSMQGSGNAIEQDTRLRFCQFLINNDRLGEAKKVWRSSTGNAIPSVQNGSFENEPMNQAFGWRLNNCREADVRCTSEAAFEGAGSLQIHFRGTNNVNFYHVSQIVPVDPGASYTLRFAQKSRGLTTDQGVFVEVSGYRCKGLYAASTPATGTSPWIEEELSFQVPSDCEAALIRVRRKESLKFDNKISGDYWLDAVRLVAFSRDTAE
ncbi:MAG: hypothetical protein WCA08_18255 [Desulfoferrobacter sp.]